MKVYDKDGLIEVCNDFEAGKIGVIPTDTVYGVCVSLNNFNWTQKIYTAKTRDSHKPLVILISKVEQLSVFGLEKTLNNSQLLKLKVSYWSDNELKNTIILPLNQESSINNFVLHRGTNKLAFRLVKKGLCFDIIEKIGPLASSSANLQGETIITCFKDFESTMLTNRVDFFVDGGVLSSLPSSIYEFSFDLEFKKIR
jgi:L-threonylcarbamoyladenylate synthase